MELDIFAKSFDSLACALDEDQNIYITICSLDEPQEFERKR